MFDWLRAPGVPARRARGGPERDRGHMHGRAAAQGYPGIASPPIRCVSIGGPTPAGSGAGPGTGQAAVGRRNHLGSPCI